MILPQTKFPLFKKKFLLFEDIPMLRENLLLSNASTSDGVTVICRGVNTPHLVVSEIRPKLKLLGASHT